VLSFFGVKIVGILMSWFGASYTYFVIGRLLVGCGQVGFFISGFVLGLYNIIVCIDVSVYIRLFVGLCQICSVYTGLFFTAFRQSSMNGL